MAKPKAFPIAKAVGGELEGWSRSSNQRRSLAERARIILLSSDGLSAATIGQRPGCSRRTVYKWRERFEDGGVEALRDRPRPGQPVRSTAEMTERILRLTTQQIPQESTHWSVRLMAKYSGASPWHVRQVWATADLKPHRLKTFKINKDRKFAEKVVDIVGLYMNPPENAVVLSVDEKTQIQALDRTQPILPLRPGQIERRTHDYKRHGTASLYAAFDIATGKVVGRVTR